MVSFMNVNNEALLTILVGIKPNLVNGGRTSRGLTKAGRPRISL